MTTTPETQAAIEQLRVDSIVHSAFLSSQQGLLVLAHVAALEAELADTQKTCLELVTDGNAVTLAQNLHRIEAERDEAKRHVTALDNEVQLEQKLHATTREHNRVLREALEESGRYARRLLDNLARSSFPHKWEEVSVAYKRNNKDLAAIDAALALTPADVESELTRLREENAHLRMEDGISKFYKQQDELKELRSHISALIAAGDSQHARLVEYFKYLGEEIARLSLNESASTGVQRLSLECAKELDAWSNAKTNAQSSLQQ